MGAPRALDQSSIGCLHATRKLSYLQVAFLRFSAGVCVCSQHDKPTFTNINTEIHKELPALPVTLPVTYEITGRLGHVRSHHRPFQQLQPGCVEWQTTTSQFCLAKHKGNHGEHPATRQPNWLLGHPEMTLMGFRMDLFKGCLREFTIYPNFI